MNPANRFRKTSRDSITPQGRKRRPQHWGKGIATAALQQFLSDPQLQERPLYASAAHDNLGSIRVLEKCGFTVTGSAKAFANGRGEEIEEAFLVLTQYADLR